MKVLVENIQQLLIKINNPNTEPEYSLTKTCYGQAADVCVIFKKQRHVMIAYCGIDCFKCDSYIATQSGNSKELAHVAAKLTKRYGEEVKPEYVICDGCKTNKRHSFFCDNLCKMRTCCIKKKYESCIECSDFPCKELQFELDNSTEAKSNLFKLK
jgi:hypothetical protein